MSKPKTYTTNNVDFATFLVFEGVEVLEFTTDGGSNVVYITFKDELGKCADLERVYLKSTYKEFRDINKWLLQKIHETLRKRK